MKNALFPGKKRNYTYNMSNEMSWIVMKDNLVRALQSCHVT